MSKPPFADAPTVPLLPGLVRPEAAPSLSVIVFSDTGVDEEYRAVFPDRLIVGANPLTVGELLEALEASTGSVLLLIDAAAGHSVAAVRRLAEAYAANPVDLMIGCNAEARLRPMTTISSFVLWSAFGWRSCDPLSGVWLCSRRFYQSVPLFPRHDVRALELEFTVQALDKGFSIRETLLPGGPSAPLRGGNARLLRALLGWCIRLRPLRSLGVLGLVLLALGVSLGYSSLRHAKDKKYRPHPVRIMAAAILLVAGLLGIQAGLLLSGALHLQREDYQLRLRAEARGREED